MFYGPPSLQWLSTFSFIFPPHLTFSSPFTFSPKMKLRAFAVVSSFSWTNENAVIWIEIELEDIKSIRLAHLTVANLYLLALTNAKKSPDFAQ